MLNMSARSCRDKRSLMGMFLITDRSTSLKFGPGNLFLEMVGPVQPGSVKPVDGSTADGLQNAAGFSHCSPGIEASKLCDTPLKGLLRRTSPDNSSSYG